MKILELCLSPDLGGLELCVLDYYDYFSTKTQTYLCAASNKKLDNYTKVQNKFSVKRNKLLPIVPALKIAKFIDKNSIDIVHIHWTKDITTAVLVKLLSKRKVKLIQSRHMQMTRFKDDFYHKWLYKNIDILHAVTHQVQDQLNKFIPSDIRPQTKMVYLGVDEPLLDRNKVEAIDENLHLKNRFVVGIVGRIEEKKGQYLLIEAIGQLQKYNITALIIGDSMDEKYLFSLKQKTVDLGIEDRVIFTGFTKDVNEYLSVCDVSVLATQKETFGLIVIESMVNKVPVIAANAGGPLEIIDDKINGVLFEGTSEDLAKKIEYLYKNREKREELCANAYQKVKKKFDKKTQMQKMYELINES